MNPIRLALLAVAASVVAASWVLVSAPAGAAPVKREPLSAGMEGLHWGASVEDVQASLRRRIEQRYETLLRNAEDPIARRELTRRQEREVEKLIVGHSRFDGQRTGMEVGIAGDEFRHGTGESVVRAREADEDRYYFFIGGKLWRIFSAWAGNAIKDTPFIPFLARMRARFGRPLSIARVTREGERVVVSAQWRSRGVHLEVRDRSEFFQSYTSSFSDPAVRERIEDLRGKPTAKKQDSADALIELVTGAGKDAEPGTEPAPADGVGALSGSASGSAAASGSGKSPAEKRRKRRVVEIY